MKKSSSIYCGPCGMAFTLALGLASPIVADPEIEPIRAASVTPYGVNGMSNVTSAEPVGLGRVNIHIRGNFYEQAWGFAGAPSGGTQVTTASGGVAMGLNTFFDIFGAVHVYNRRPETGQDQSGWGTSVLGAKVSIPFSRDTPIRVGAELAGLFGTGSNQINYNNLDGYNYLETRMSTDVMARLTQSILLMNEGRGVKIHFNEGVISSFQTGREVALVTGVGVEVIPIISLILGLEANSRTSLTHPSLKDPLWVTPSATWRTPAYVNINVGADISVAGERASNRSLEPWRAFGGLTFSLDARKDAKREAAERARQDSLERAALENQARIADARADSLLQVATERAWKARQDSLALLTAEQRLAAERAMRSDLEDQLLTTGLLVLDAVYFETAKTDISLNSEPYLTMIAKMLSKYPKLMIEIGGHTDNVGGMEYNTNLSMGRATSVVRYMLDAAPELQGRLVAKGYSYTEPKAPNTTAEGRQLNRRTELKVLNPEALQEYR